MYAEIKKGSGINGLVNSHSGQKPEEIKTVDVKPLKIMQEFDEFISKVPRFLFMNEAKYTHAANRIVHSTLTPKELETIIPAFLDSSAAYKDRENYRDAKGFFVSKLIQNSYDAGNNDFNFNLEGYSQVNFPTGLTADKEPAKITLSADQTIFVGSLCESCVFDIRADQNLRAGNGSLRSEFYIVGKTTRVAHDARKSLFDFFGEVDGQIGIASSDCTFVTRRRTVAEYLRKELFRSQNPLLASRNKIILKRVGSEPVMYYD